MCSKPQAKSHETHTKDADDTKNCCVTIGAQTTSKI